MRKILLAMLLSMTLAGCRLPSLFATSPGAVFDAASNGAGPQAEAPLTLSGRVTFPRRVQATIKDDVAVAATVSLINTGSNRTEVTGLTDDQGVFSLTMPRTYRPDPAATYYLEAVKGLSSNQPGYAAARVRTIVKFQGGWVSLTNQALNINTLTTAVSVGAALRKGTATPVDFDALLGKVADVYTPVTNLSLSDVDTLSAMITGALADDQDPVGAITLNTGSNTFELALSQAPAVSTSSVAVAGVGDTLTLTGSGFNPTPGNNVVKVNGVPMTVVSATATSLTVQVPSGATSGPITVQVGSLIILGPVLSVTVAVTGFSSAQRQVGESLTVTGTGFDPSNPANNVVVFTGEATASVTAATATSLTMAVPTGAVSGPVRVNVLGSQGVSASSFRVSPTLSGFSPAGGMAGQSVVLSGTGFSSTLASNSVTVNGASATLVQASATSLRITVPAGATTGQIAVTVVGQTITSAGNFTVGQPISSNATIQAFAGTTTPPANRQASDWAIPNPQAIVRDASNNTYSIGGGRIYKIDAAGVITHVAGTGVTGYSGDGGPATNAQFGFTVVSLAVDGSGNLYFADSENYRIRKVDAASHTITTVVGTGTGGFTADGAVAATAAIAYPMGVEVDAAGNLYFSDSSNYRIRKVSAATGLLSTVAGNGVGTWSDGGGVATAASLLAPKDLLLDGDNLYVSDWTSVRKIGLSGNTMQTLAGVGTAGYVDGSAANARFFGTQGLAKDAAGNVYVADSEYNHRIRKIDPAGNVTTVAGSGASSDSSAGGYSGDGGPGTSALLKTPKGVVVDAAGNLYISDYGNNRIRMVTASTGVISTAWGNGFWGSSGDGGLATAAQISAGGYIALDASGNLYLSDTYRIRKIAAGTGIISSFAGTGGSGSSGDGGQASAATLSPTGLAFDAPGNLYVNDTASGCIRKIAPNGVISTLVSGLSLLKGLAIDASGNLYVSMGISAATSRVVKIDPSGNVTPFAGLGASLGDNGPATSAKLYSPQGMVVDAAGNVYIADANQYRVRKVDPSGIITTVAGTGTAGSGGDGGQATMAQLSSPWGLAMDAAGNLYISESVGHRIRRVDPSGIISTVAGTGTAGYSGDNGAAASAQFNAPRGIALGNFGSTLSVVDTGNNRIRKVQ
ncbi:MAG TPA: IPT/TIG domain-containing protein [Stenomitos sp.]